MYQRIIPVEFNHCDPAGIVFYPRYFEMTNSVVENFFGDVAGRSYAAMMAAGQGVPTAKLEVNFLLPSRLGDRLDWRLTVERLGGSSIQFQIQAHCGGEHRLTADLVLVWVDGGRPKPWPAPLRAAITTFMEAP